MEGRSNLLYQRGDFEAQFYQYQTYKSYSGGRSSFWWIFPDLDSDGQYRYSSGKAYGGSLIFPSYLSSIRSDAGSILFHRGKSTELEYDYSRIKGRYEMTMTNNSNSPILAYLYPILRLNGDYDGDYTHVTDALKWQQLNAISIFGSDVSKPAIKRFVFEYSNNPNVRLTLRSVAVDDYNPYNNNTGV